jgi:hypothetical protein
VFRTAGQPFSRDDGGLLRNSLRMRLVNRSGQPQTYTIVPADPDDVEVTVIDQATLKLDAGESTMVPLSVQFKQVLVSRTGYRDASLRVTDESGNEREVEYRLLGPQR